MATDTISIPERQVGIETDGIERVSAATRPHRRILDNFTIWMSANLVSPVSPPLPRSDPKCRGRSPGDNPRPGSAILGMCRALLDTGKRR